MYIVEEFKKYKAAYIAALCGAAIVGSILAVGIPASIRESAQNKKDNDLLRMALLKADKNHDKILQKQEISDLLKQLNVDFILPDFDAIPVPRIVEEKSQITYFDNAPYINIALGRKDLEEYLK